MAWVLDIGERRYYLEIFKLCMIVAKIYVMIWQKRKILDSKRRSDQYSLLIKFWHR